MARRRKGIGIPGLSFSWKRALGVTKAKRNFARMTGIPTTKSGRQRKFGKAAGCGCLLLLCAMVTVIGIFTIICRGDHDIQWAGS